MDDYVALGARISAGLIAGLYLTFAVAIMPALHGMGGAAFADTMNRINVSIINPAFLLVFFTAPLLTVVAAVLVRSPVVYAAATLGVITLVTTLVVNVPLNDKLASGGNAGRLRERVGTVQRPAHNHRNREFRVPAVLPLTSH